MRKIIINIVLMFCAIFLLLTIGLFGLIYTIGLTIITFNTKSFVNYWGNLLYQINIGIDQIGNVLLAEFMNKHLIKNMNIYSFGKVNDTISYVLAKNIGNLTGLGQFIVNILEAADPGHMEKSLNRN